MPVASGKTRSKLTPKEFAFVRFYVEQGFENAALAARKAGYTDLSAEVATKTILRRARVVREIERMQNTLRSRTGYTVEKVLCELEDVYEKCAQKRPVKDEDGKEVYGQYDAAGATRALSLIGKHLGMWREQIEVTQKIDVAGILSAARARLGKGDLDAEDAIEVPGDSEGPSGLVEAGRLEERDTGDPGGDTLPVLEDRAGEQDLPA